MREDSAARVIPPALMADPPTLGEELDRAHGALAAALQESLQQKAVYREVLAQAAVYRKRYFDACTRLNEANSVYQTLVREAKAVSA